MKEWVAKSRPSFFFANIAYMANLFGLFATQFFTNFRWDEPRFETNNTVKEDQWTPIDLQFMNQLWVPNIFIYDLRRLQDTSKPIASIFAKSEIECNIYGANLYLIKLKLKLNFDFYFFIRLHIKENHKMFSLRITVNIFQN